METLLDEPVTPPAAAPGSWVLVVPNGQCFDGGVDCVLGPYGSALQAWAVHFSCDPWPGESGYGDPEADPSSGVDSWHQALQDCRCEAFPLEDPAGPGGRPAR